MTEKFRWTDYQNLDSEKVESKFWDRGKWDNYILPHIKEDVREMTYVDMGCNAGLFLKIAKDMGFKRAAGIDINPMAIERGRAYKAEVGGKYDLKCGEMVSGVDDLPVADYMTFINTHYYLLIQDWLELVDKLRKKARYVIITGIRKRKEYFCMASGFRASIKRYFKDWELVGSISQLDREGDPRPRSLESYCFKNPFLERVSLDKLERGNHIQGNFHEQIDAGVHPLDTRYFKLFRRKNKKVPIEELEKRMYDKAVMFWDVKRYGVKEPIIVNHNYRVLDGNHRKKLLEYLGDKTTIVRKVG